MMTRILIFLTLLTVVSLAQAQQVNDFSLTDAASGKEISLSSLANGRAVVLVFFDHNCPYGKYYLQRLQDLHNKFKDNGIDFLLVSSGRAATNPAAMAAFAQQQQLSIPYLADLTGQARSQLKATRVPEAFVLKPEKGMFTLVYRGAIDDNPQSAGDVNHAFLAEALVSLLNNKKPAVNQTRPAGCLIK